MLKRVSKFLLFLLIVYVGLCVVLFTSQRSFIYFPPHINRTNDATTMKLENDGETLLVSMRQREGSKAIIYFGGNGEDVLNNLPSFTSIFPDSAIYLSHYRGYSGSTGKPSEQALVSDAQILFDYVRRQHTEITVIGRSLGSGVAVQLASQRPVTKLVLVTPYNSILELAENQFPYFPIHFLLQDKYESWRYVQSITIPTLIIAAQRDEVIPSSSTQSLFQHFSKGVAKTVVIKNSGHNTISNNLEYHIALRDFNSY